MRNVRPPPSLAPPAAPLPDWFFERNLVLHKGEGQGISQPQDQISVWEEDGGGGDQPVPGETSQPKSRYALPKLLWQELYASVKAGMHLPLAKYANEPSVKRSHLMLQYPGDDGILFLDAVVKKLAQELGADLVTLSAQDIAQLCTEYDLEDIGKTTQVRSLGYDLYHPPSSQSWLDPDEFDDEETPAPRSKRLPGLVISPPIELPPRFKSLVTTLEDRLDDIRARKEDSRSTTSNWAPLVSEIVSSPRKPTKRPTAPETPESSSADQPPRRGVIIQVQDYMDMQIPSEGARFINLLQQTIQDRRRGGSPVMLIGTASNKIHGSASQEASRASETAGEDPLAKTLIVTPAGDPAATTKTFAEDRKARILDINVRHLQEMLRTRLGGQPVAVEDDIFGRRDWRLDPNLVKESGLDERYWLYSQVHWAVTLALGCVEANQPFGIEHLARGISLMHSSDTLKNKWLQVQGKEITNKEEQSENKREQLLNSLKQSCNKYEKKLLNGVVDAQSIRTTFSDVHVPPETIEALRTLTSLSLVRPEAFTYGVLATDKIPGLLLYGPPGTGKTLLAKAVARESGATVLEVSGSDVFEMFVGEGEKNVKAIFTLAKKLSPCVVFIDEADSIFRTRAGADRRSSHRELINQFLKEWDGMNDLSAFMMVATNRPFDLDDAVLRRLPRRLLVDLPTEKDRVAILKIHLKGETLDPSVDLAELARRTPLYSGSDLKNLSVAAALACVREENAMAAQHQGEEPYKFPERRTLTWTHFERGMEEISASINEDMSSLTAIKKFDEQYGDRKGRRKKRSGWGFVPPSANETREETARVRS